MKERILALIVALEMSTRQFSFSIGKSESFARSITKNIGSDVIENILRAYPQINPYWLLLGEGDMFISTSVIDGKNISKDNTISGNQIVGDRSILITGPTSGSQKIIYPDKIKAINEEALDETDQCPDGDSLTMGVYKRDLLHKIAMQDNEIRLLKESNQAKDDTISALKETLALYRDNKSK